MGKFIYGDVIFPHLLSLNPKSKSFVEVRTRHNMRAARARKSAKFQRARASERVLLVFFERAGGQAPQLWEAWPGARARARALSTTQNCKLTTFLLVNFKNDHGKSCSVSRDWQPPQISAQSLPISQSYGQKPEFCYFQRADQRAISEEKCMGSYVPIKKFPHMGEGPYVGICRSCFLHFFDIIFPHLFRFCSISMIE